MLIDELPTPALIVERQRMLDNVARMQFRASQNGVALRPHVKTHKSLYLARIQEEHGAQGFTVAKPSEAEVFVNGGFRDIRIAYTVVGEDRLARILRLMENARISFCVDTIEGARAASAFFAARNAMAEVLVEVDTGHHRAGVPWNRRDSVSFAADVAALPGLRLAGILTHAGQAYNAPLEDETTDEARQRVADYERDAMLDFAVRLREAGIGGKDFEISIGSTPGISAFENMERGGLRITEIRPGNYIFADAIQVALGAAMLEQCALTVLATVVSRHREADGRDRLCLDAGKKIITSDTGYGTDGYGILLYNPAIMLGLPHAHIIGLSEEHAWVRGGGGSTLRVGDQVRFVPNHACVAVNTQDRMFLVDGDDVLAELPVDARGCVA